jgi:Fic family protein
VWLLETLAESKGKQALHERQAPRLLKTLEEIALLEGTESSNRIDGVTIDPERLRPLVLGNARPRDRSEEEIVGYRNALTWVHANHEKVPIEPETLRRLHALAQEGTIGDAGQWKESQNEIVELDPDGRLEVRFRPVEPALVPSAVEELCLAYKDSLEQLKITPLLAAASLVFDFLCIHPFREANGRVSRLLTLLALYHHGHRVGRYIGLERIIEQTKESYYETLQASSVGWHDGSHDIMPWFHYFLSTTHAAYREFEESARR